VAMYAMICELKYIGTYIHSYGYSNTLSSCEIFCMCTLIWCFRGIVIDDGVMFLTSKSFLTFVNSSYTLIVSSSGINLSKHHLFVLSVTSLVAQLASAFDC
jgi:hypothetical protein